MHFSGHNVDPAVSKYEPNWLAFLHTLGNLDVLHGDGCQSETPASPPPTADPGCLLSDFSEHRTLSFFPLKAENTMGKLAQIWSSIVVRSQLSGFREGFQDLFDATSPSQVPFDQLSLGEGSPTKIDYIKKGTLILTSLLEDLDSVAQGRPFNAEFYLLVYMSYMYWRFYQATFGFQVLWATSTETTY